MFRVYWLVTFVAIASCSDPGTRNSASVVQENAATQVHERGSARFGPGETMCIYTVSNLVEPLDVFEFTRSNGGRSCYRNETRTVFAPASTPACEADSPAFLRVEQVTTAEDGERQFLACSAVGGSAAVGDENTVLIISQPLDGDEADEREFALHIADLRALVTNGALVASSFQSGFGIACFDTDQPELLRRQIEMSVKSSEGVSVVVRSSNCDSELHQANMRAIG
ncbi:hypothetical protein ACETK8_08360 [Brevundimonas staleyi]